ncbi:MAG: chromosomal replication initiator protein DnaA [Magnetococcales bacterium]|nr:chromosomal replication initiator protein DnaA [Magnetococcales bacterium]
MDALPAQETNNQTMDDHLWERTLDAVKEQVSVRVFDAWIKPLRPAGPVTNSQLELLVDDHLTMEMVRRYGAILESCLASEVGNHVQISYRLESRKSEAREPESDEPSQPDVPGKVSFPEKVVVADVAIKTSAPVNVLEGTGLDTRFAFESFVVGGCNQFVHAAAERVAERPAQAYNPLFIHGGVGLGKTHIMQAIGNRVAQTRPDLKVLYISSEKFMTEMIHSLRNQGIMAFKEKFRSVNLLLVDDIQFIAGKKATQEEFFHTFNALYETKSQIVLTSDSFPADIENLEERLRSRLAMGLVADISAPDLETRVAILKQKAAMVGMALMDDVAFFLADAIQTNIRELEGALIRVSAFASLTHKPITMGLVKETLRDIVKGHDKQVTIDTIQKTVASYYKIRLADLLSDRRTRMYSHPRQVAMYLCKQLTGHSYPQIGQHFGGRDHTTVLHAVKSIEKKQAKDPNLAEELESLLTMLRR